jgi:uncharacterized protein (TIGR00369 family)
MPETLPLLSDERDAAIRGSFARQGMMQALGAEIVSLVPGRVVFRLPFSGKVTQQQGLFHGGAVAALADIAAGYSAMSLGAPDSEVTTVEFKINFINGAVGDAIEATGVVEKAGRSLVVARVEVEAITGADRKTCALMQATMMPVLKKY